MLLINIAGNRTTLTVIDSDAVVFNKVVKGYTEHVKKIHKISTNYDIKTYTVAKSEKIIKVNLDGKLNFKSDLKMVLGDIRLIKSNI